MARAKPMLSSQVSRMVSHYYENNGVAADDLAAPADIDSLIQQLKDAANKAGLPADTAESWLRSKAADGKVDAEEMVRPSTIATRARHSTDHHPRQSSYKASSRPLPSSSLVSPRMSPTKSPSSAHRLQGYSHRLCNKLVSRTNRETRRPGKSEDEGRFWDKKRTIQITINGPNGTPNAFIIYPSGRHSLCILLLLT